MSGQVHGAASPPMLGAALAAFLRSAVTALLAGAAAFVVARRLAGALATPLGPVELLLAAFLLAGLAQVGHAARAMPARQVANALVSLAVLAVAASLSVGGSPRPALAAFWAVVVGGELWAWRGALPARRSTKAASPIAPPPAADAVDDGPSEESEPVEPAGNVLQQLTRRVTAEGGQELSGWLRMQLGAGQQTGSLHVAFCPSFDQAPQVQAEAVSGPDCRIRAAQVLPYGARLDVKLDEPAEENASVLVWFAASDEVV